MGVPSSFSFHYCKIVSLFLSLYIYIGKADLFWFWRQQLEDETSLVTKFHSIWWHGLSELECTLLNAIRIRLLTSGRNTIPQKASMILLLHLYSQPNLHHTKSHTSCQIWCIKFPHHFQLLCSTFLFSNSAEIFSLPPCRATIHT